MSKTLKLKNISKRYGKFIALKDISYEFETGIYGLIGPNGAGKSTMFKILTTSILSDEGCIFYNEKNIKNNMDKFRSIIGYMPQQFKAYDHLTGYEFLYYMAALKGLKKEETKEQINHLSKKVNLKDSLNKKVGTLSGGMRQRLMFIQAMLGNPEILILDEPTSGLDPYERIVMRNQIFELSKNKIVIIATHVMQDIEYIADKLILLKQGSIIEQGDVVSLLNNMEGYIHETILSKEELESYNNKIVRLTQTNDGIRVRYISDYKMNEYVNADLEDLYLRYMIDEITIL